MSAPIVGATRRQHLADAAAALDVTLADDEIKAIQEHYTPREPTGCTNWHLHSNGQTLHVLEGIALVGTRDGTVIRARAGETVACAPGVDHWHGAAPDTLAVHIAIVVASSDHSGTDWLEPVTDQTYLAAA